MTSTFHREEVAVVDDLTHDHRRKIPALTGIRGYAALWVVAYHLVSMGWRHFTGSMPTTGQAPIVASGYLGVELFFILSGFILVKIYGRSVSSATGIRDFAVGRIFRILPVYYLSLLVLLVLLPFDQGRWQGGTPHSLANLLWCLLLIQSWIGRATVWNTPGWSLSAEFLAYLFFPLIAAFAMRLHRTWLILAVALASFVVLTASFHHHELRSLNDPQAFGLERCLCEFIIGVALGRLHMSGQTSAKLGTILLVIGSVLLIPPIIDSRFDLLAVIAFSCLVLSAGSHSSPVATIFGNRAMHWIGEISFSIYVLHWPLLELAFRFAPGPRSLVVSLVLVLIAVIPLAWLTWRSVEVPGQAAGRYLVARLRGRD